jgi:branched-chain amino acid transport system substrate-binding protein
MRYQRQTAACCVAAVLALAVTACGSDSSETKSAAGTPTAGTADSAPKLTGAPFRVGIAGSFTGTEAARNGQLPAVISAWVDYTNAHGGISGHPVKAYVKDDAGNASTALQNAQSLVEEGHVQAIVDLTQQDQVFVKYISGTDVPVTGGASDSQPFATSPDFFPSGGGQLPALTYGVGSIAKAGGDTKVGALVCSSTPVCAGFFEPFSHVLQNVIGGMSLVYTATISDNAPNYTAQCLAAKQAGVQAMFIGEFPPVVQRVVDDCAQQGFKPDVFVPGGIIVKDLLTDPNADGMTQVAFNAPANDTSTPGGRLFNAMIDQYAPDVKSQSGWNDTDIDAFTGLQLFKLDAETNKLTPDSTPAQVKAGLYKLPSTTLGGVAPPLKFVKGKPTIVPCWFNTQIKDGKEVLPTGVTPQCIPPEKTAAFFKVFG